MRKCDVCQKFGNVIHVPAEALHFVTILWPFYKWGIDIVGPLPLATCQRKFMLVATDYFTKLEEAEAYEHVTTKKFIQFVQKNIVCRFGVPCNVLKIAFFLLFYFIAFSAIINFFIFYLFDILLVFSYKNRGF